MYRVPNKLRKQHVQLCSQCCADGVVNAAPADSFIYIHKEWHLEELLNITCWCVPTTEITLPLIYYCINILRLRQDGHHFPDDIFKCIFLNENVWISIMISLKFVPKGPINNIRLAGTKPLSEPRMVSLLTYISDTQLQCVNSCCNTLQ